MARAATLETVATGSAPAVERATPTSDDVRQFRHKIILGHFSPLTRLTTRCVVHCSLYPYLLHADRCMQFDVVTNSRLQDSSNRNFAKSFVYDIALAQSSGTIPSDEDLVVVVDGIGASYPFRVAADVYATALAASLRVFYYQRNGVALDTTWYPWLGLDFDHLNRF